jgi:hypothetical protein
MTPPAPPALPAPPPAPLPGPETRARRGFSDQEPRGRSRWAVVAALALAAAVALAGCAKSSGHGPTTTQAGPRSVVLWLRPLSKSPPNDCGAFPPNMPTDKPVAGLYVNQCIQLDPGGFPVSRAAVEQRQSKSGLDVRVTLQGDDVQKLADFTRSHVGEQVGVVGLNKVLALLSLKDPITDGRFIMSGLNQGDVILVRNQLR